MKSLPLTPEIQAIAERVVWFETPEQALADTPRFLAYVMTYGNYADMQVIRRQVSDDEVRMALDQAPPGIYDGRSWAYWNLKLGRYPPPPMPERRMEFPASAG